MAWDGQVNPTAILLFIGVISLQFERGWRVKGEATTPGLRGEGVTVSPSSLHHLLTGSSPKTSIISQPRPPTPAPAWLQNQAAHSAPSKTPPNASALIGAGPHKEVQPSVNVSHHFSEPATTISPQRTEQGSFYNELQRHLQDIKTHIGSVGRVKGQGPSSLPSSRFHNKSSSPGSVSDTEIEGKANNTSHSSHTVTLTDKQPSVQKDKSNLLDAPGGGQSGGVLYKEAEEVPPDFTERTVVDDDPAASLSNHTNHTDPGWAGSRPRDPYRDPPADTALPPGHNGTAPGDGGSTAPPSKLSDSSVVNFTESWEVERTNSSSNRSSVSSMEELEETLVDVLANSSSSSTVWSSLSSSSSGGSNSSLDDGDYEDYDDYDDDDSDEDTDWYYNVDDDGRDYYDEGGGLQSSNRADTGNDDYEYETSDQAVEDMRPGSDNYYRGSKISDQDWIRERSKVDMNEIAASHPGQEVFVGPHTFEAEFGPISEVRSETMEMHQPFVPESSHDASLSILVFYTWIGIVTVMVIGAFIALKHRHRILKVVERFRAAGYFYQRRRTIAATRTVLATRFAMEEGQNLLTHQHV